jgi:hypothetical protein
MLRLLGALVGLGLIAFFAINGSGLGIVFGIILLAVSLMGTKGESSDNDNGPYDRGGSDSYG